MKTWKHHSTEFSQRFFLCQADSGPNVTFAASFKIWRLFKTKSPRFFVFFVFFWSSPNFRSDRCLVFTAETPRLGPKSVLDRLREKLSTCPKGGERAKVSESWAGMMCRFLRFWLKEWKWGKKHVFFIAFPGQMPEVAWNVEKTWSRWSKLSKPDLVGQSLTTKSSQTYTLGDQHPLDSRFISVCWTLSWFFWNISTRPVIPTIVATTETPECYTH